MDFAAGLTMGAAFLAAGGGVWAAWEARVTRRQAVAPPPVPLVVDFRRYDESVWHRDDGKLVGLNLGDRYRLSVVNDGVRPVRVLDMGYEIRDRLDRDGRALRRDGETWDLVSWIEEPVTVAMSEGLDFEFTVWDQDLDPRSGERPVVGRAFVDVGGRPRQWVEVQSGDGEV